MPREKADYDAESSTAGVLSGQVTLDSYAVDDVQYFIHHKRGAPPDAPRTMRVEYRIGLNGWQSEWICFEHNGFARHKAELWWRRRSNVPVPDTATEAVALAEAGALARTRAITVRSVAGEKYSRVVDYDLEERPPWRPTETAGVQVGPEPDYAPPDDSIPF
jgi:DNA repair protein RadD